MVEMYRQGNEVRVQPKRDIVGNAAEGLRAKLNEAIQEGASKVLLDLDEVETIDSIGLSVLIGAHMHLSQHGGHLEIDNARMEIYDLFRTMRLDKHFAIHLKE